MKNPITAFIRFIIYLRLPSKLLYFYIIVIALVVVLFVASHNSDPKYEDTLWWFEG